jgi:protein-S-isoprenylcysteine O-methyltransferase Ste14
MMKSKTTKAADAGVVLVLVGIAWSMLARWYLDRAAFAPPRWLIGIGLLVFAGSLLTALIGWISRGFSN